MNALVETFRAQWDARTPREQHLLTIMFALLVAVLVWLAILRPVWGWRAEAAERREQAAHDLVQVRAAASALGGQSAPRRPAPAEGWEPLIQRAAQAHGLTVAPVMDASGALGFQLSGVSSAAAFGWMASLQTDHGLTVCRLSVVENANATLNVEGAFCA